jgi:hypothetical protein
MIFRFFSSSIRVDDEVRDNSDEDDEADKFNDEALEEPVKKA